MIINALIETSRGRGFDIPTFTKSGIKTSVLV